MKGLIGISIFVVALIVGLSVNRWAKAKGTFRSPFTLGWTAFGLVWFAAIVVILVLDELGLYFK